MRAAALPDGLPVLLAEDSARTGRQRGHLRREMRAVPPGAQSAPLAEDFARTVSSVGIAASAARWGPLGRTANGLDSRNIPAGTGSRVRH